jgi:hypothetical protein
MRTECICWTRPLKKWQSGLSRFLVIALPALPYLTKYAQPYGALEILHRKNNANKGKLKRDAIVQWQGKK